MAYNGKKIMFIFYGPGGVGKTSVVNIICSIGSNVLVEIPGRFMAKKVTVARNYGNSLPDDIKAKLPNTRLALVGDVEVTSDDEHVNVQTVKELTGGDEGSHGRVSVTSIMSLNKLFFYEFQSDYTQADRTRRITVIPTVLNRRTKDTHMTGLSENSKIELVALSIATRTKSYGGWLWALTTRMRRK